MGRAYLNHIAVAVPAQECHAASSAIVRESAAAADRAVLARVWPQLGIARRYTVLPRFWGSDDRAFYRPDHCPGTAERMAMFRAHAWPLAAQALDALFTASGVPSRRSITHLIVTTCTGFYAPGLDYDIVTQADLPPSTQRLVLGFMGCYAAIPALRHASAIVHSDPTARVLIVNVELCSLHFRPQAPLDQLLTFLLFADGAAASVVSAEPRGLRLDGFHHALVPASADAMQWQIHDHGFFMHLDAAIPQLVAAAVRTEQRAVCGPWAVPTVRHWAIHPGGRAILDAVAASYALPDGALADSRAVLRDYGNMSSATIMFVLQRMLAVAAPGPGVAMAFGPGLTLESMRFTISGEVP
ncbi:MAG: type III polyketide synthase [Deltaproteobacteria bacterium]|nr:type III polyketide synthase [Deltaproteobacteria bacterium]